MYTDEFITYQENRFDSFCKVVIRNACSDNRRIQKRRADRYISLDEMHTSIFDIPQVEDNYVTYSRTYHVKGIDIVITDNRLGELMQYIMPNQRAVLLLSFFKDYSDIEIAKLMGISHKTVAYRKDMAMKKLKALLEGMDDGR